MTKSKHKTGIAPIIIAIIVALLMGSGAVYLKTQDKLNIESAKEILGVSNTTDSPQTIDDLTLDKTSLDFSFSSMPKLEVSPLNIEIPQIASPKIGSVDSSFNLNTDSLINSDSIKLEAPKMNLDASSFGISIPSNIQIPASVTIPEGINIPSDIPSSVPSSAPSTGGGEAPSASQSSPTVDCNQFSSVPSCSYIQSYGQQAYDSCKKCFPNK